MSDEINYIKNNLESKILFLIFSSGCTSKGKKAEKAQVEKKVKKEVMNR